MRWLVVLSLLGLAQFTVRAEDAPMPSLAPSYTLYGVFMAGDADGNVTSFHEVFSRTPSESQALVIGSMVTMGSNSFTVGWALFNVISTPEEPKPLPVLNSSAGPIVDTVAGPLLLYGGKLPAVMGFPSSTLGGRPGGLGRGGSANGLPVLSTNVTAPTEDSPGQVDLQIDSDRGNLSNVQGEIPPAGWFAITLATEPSTVIPPLDPIQTFTPPTTERDPPAVTPPTPAETPEPTTVALVGIGLVGVLTRRIVRRSR